jgi:hypothetical protein
MVIVKVIEGIQDIEVVGRLEMGHWQGDTGR